MAGGKPRSCPAAGITGTEARATGTSPVRSVGRASLPAHPHGGAADARPAALKTIARVWLAAGPIPASYGVFAHSLV